ncbi:MAG: hypothetical protein PHI12_06575 [Dehalococcoidales bacterium]|nr:hypothetical protein [Dehalococcoidales bacterium]
MIIRFNSIEEFTEELKKEFEDKPRFTLKPILRLTCQYRGSSASPNIKLATVVATIKSASDPQDIIRLEKYCGDIWSAQGASVNDKTGAHIQEAYEPIEKACKELKIEVRAGMYEPEKGD